MTKRILVVGVLACMVAIAGLAIAQETEQAMETVVETGEGEVLHRSGNNLIIDVKEGPNGPGIRKFNIKSTDGLTFYDRQGQEIQVPDLKKGQWVRAVRTSSRPAAVVITYEEAQQEIAKAEPAAAAAPAAPAAAPVAAPAPAPSLPSTGSSLPLLLLVAVVILAVAISLTVVRKI